ncbi:MAG: hypothetical protein GQ527_00715 [Bacteroidales bacterium]|nr:hypothetical protein [Bacteroidales bacterium]
MKLTLNDLRIRSFVLSLLVIILISSSVFSQSSVTDVDIPYKADNSWSRFSVSMGGFLLGNNSNISIGSETLGLGVNINIEEALGLETSTIAFRANARYRIGKAMKHSVSVGYFSINRNAYKVLEKELQIGNLTFPIGTNISSNFDLTILRAKYDYSFLQKEHVSIGASIGFYIMPISFSIKAANSKEQATSFIAPMPVIGLRTEFLLTEKFFLHQSTELLLLSIDDFKGRILDLDIALEHRTFKHFSFGLGFNSNRLVIKAKGKDYPNIDFYGSVEMEYMGVYVFVKYRI